MRGLAKVAVLVAGVLSCPLPEAVATPLGTAPSNASDTLRVYAIGRPASMVGPIVEEFTQLTGAVVDVRYGQASDLPDALRNGGREAPDVVFAQDLGDAFGVTDLLAPLSREVLNEVPAWATTSDGRWVGVSARVRVVVYNRDRVSVEELPSQLTGFTMPSWGGGRIGWAPENGSLKTWITAIRSAWGEDAAAAWLRRIQANRPKVYSGNTAVVRAVASGEVDVGFVNHSYALRLGAAADGDFAARNHYMPDGGPAGLAVVSGVGVRASSSVPDTAERFVAFLLSPVGQEIMATAMCEYPVVEMVPSGCDLRPFEQVHTPDLAAYDLATLSDWRPTEAVFRELGID